MNNDVRFPAHNLWEASGFPFSQELIMGSPQHTVITGPVTGGKRGWPFAGSMLDIKALGYEEAEYFVDGHATCYRQAERSDWGRDGRWQVERAAIAPYRTRFLVYRPVSPERFNGTVVVTWNNVTAGFELFGADSRELFEGGYALVCASVQKVGIDGLPPVRQGLAAWDPERYGTLNIPGDDYSYDIYAQIGRVVGPRRDPGSIDPMAGLRVERVIAQGASQSAGRLGTYVNALGPDDEVFDGYILCIYFGSGTPIQVGEAVVNINQPAFQGSVAEAMRGRNLIRDDLKKPVFIVNSELEAISCHGVRQPDSDHLRWWEAAGTCHVSRQMSLYRQRMFERDQVVSRPLAEGINAVPMGPLYDAAFHHMHRWLKDAVAPPVQPRIEFTGDPAEVRRDADGIAFGGIRLPQVDVPLAHNSAISQAEGITAYLDGMSRPFSPEQVRARYGNQKTFLERFEAAARTAVDAGVLMEREVDRLREEAAASWPK